MQTLNPVTPTELTSPLVEASVTNLPALVTDTPLLPRGEVLDATTLTPFEEAAIAKRVAEFDIYNMAMLLQFGAAGQQRASAYLDRLLADIRTDEIGPSADIMTELADGISIMRLDKVRDQLQHPPGRVMRTVCWAGSWVGLWKDYIHAFFANREMVISKFEKVQARGRNSIKILEGESGKHDQMMGMTVQQMADLRLDLLAGERILYNKQAEYDKRRTEVLAESPPDSLKLSQLRDFRALVTRFHVRWLRLVEAYVKASSVALEQIRMAQEAITIEIQNIDESLLFDLTDFKRAVVQLASWRRLSIAAAGRKRLRDALVGVESVLADATVGGHRAAKESQGDALDAANRLKTLVDRMVTGMEASRQAEDTARERRQQALMVFREAKQAMDAAQIEDLRASADASVL